MSYFSAVMAQGNSGWRARDIDITDAQTPDELLALLKSVAVPAHPVIAVIEHEDEWFAIIRVEDEADESVLFVSEFANAMKSPLAELLAPAADVDAPGGFVSANVSPPSAAAEGFGLDEDFTAAEEEEGDQVSAEDPVPSSTDDLSDEDFVDPEHYLDGDADETSLQEVEEVDPNEANELSSPDLETGGEWAGSPTILSDLGVSATMLVEWCSALPDKPGEILDNVGSVVGFADLLEALR